MRKQNIAPSSRFEISQPNLVFNMTASWLAKRLLCISHSIRRSYNAISPILMTASCGWLLSINAYAQIVANPSAPGQQRPTVINTGNGVLQVNIQTPSAAGVSRNSYSQFDVPNTGVVLNNSRLNTQSQIGGAVQANPWLAGGEARIILNEINSSNPSQIRGFIEVAGSRAEVVIANPSGINVNGGGFINVSRATLTTGTPIVNGGNLEGYIVDRGQINFSGAGLDARQTDFTSIIARSVAVNADIWAQQLSVITGPNQISINNALPAGASASSTTGSGAVPQYAIDVSQLGGMYANKILLLGTEAGVGVHNAGSIGASAGEIIVTANGRVENKGDIAAKQEMRFNVAGEIANTGNISSESTMALNAGSILNNGTLNSQRDIQIVAGTLSNHGVINSTGETTATVEGAIDNSDGTIQAQRIALSSTTAGIDNQRGKITQIAVADLDVTARTLINTNNGMIGTPAPAPNNGSTDPGAGNGSSNSGGNSDTPDSDNQNNGNGGTGSTSPVVVPSGYLRAAGVINNDGGQVTAGGTITANVVNLDNSGGNLNLRTLTVSADGVVNRQGNINVTGDLLANGGTFDNQNGKVMVGGNLQSTVTTLNNQSGTIQASRLGLNVAGNLDNTAGILRQNSTQDAQLTVGDTFINEGGTLETLGNLALQANKITGANGKITAQGNLQIDSSDASLRNGQWVSGGNATIDTAALDNTSGVISSGATLDLHSTSLNNHAGKIVANNIGIRADSTLDNSLGTIQGVTGVDVQASTLTNDGGRIEAIGTTGNLNIQAGKLTNADGSIVNAGSGSTTIAVQTSLDNGGTIAANGSATLSAANLKNLVGGSIVSKGPLSLNALQVLDNAGTMNSAGTLQINQPNSDIINTGRIVSAGKLSINTANLDNTTGQIATVTGTGANVEITTGDFLNHAGTVQADAQLSIDTTKAIDNTGGLLHGGANIDVHSGAEINNDNGVIESTAALTVAGKSISNGSGRIVNAGTGNTNITSAGDITTNGIIAGNGNVTLNAATLSNNASGTIASAGNLDLGITQGLTNQGAINSNGTLTFNQANANFRNSGKIASGGNITINANNFDNSNGTIETGAGSGGDVSLTSQRLANSAGHIVTDRDLGIQTQQLQSAGGMSSGRDITLAFSGNYTADATSQLHANRNLNLSTTGTLTNAGTLEAEETLTVSADALNNNANGVIQAQDVALTVAGTLNNAGNINAANDLNISAETLFNSNSIIGQNVVVSTQNLTNSGSATLLGSTSDMSLWIRNQLNNTDGANIYSAGNMSIASGATRDGNGLLTGRTVSVNNNESTIEAVGNLEMVSNVVNNIRPNIVVSQVKTDDETRHMTMPSWWVNGQNTNFYNPYSSNYRPKEIYYINPADILENTTYITPDGYTIGRAVIRTHANDSVFFVASSSNYGAYGQANRITDSVDGTKVIYYLTSQSNQVNPDQVPGTGGNLIAQYTNVQSWNDLPTFSSQYGSCNTNCIQLITEPGYNDPTSIIIAGTNRGLAPVHESLEVARDAHHVAFDDVLQPTAGAEAKIRSGSSMRISVDQSLNNQYASIMAGGALQVDGGTTATINNVGMTLYRRHTFDGTWYTANGVAVHYDMPSISEAIGSVGGVMSGNQGVAITGRSFSNIDLSAGTAANIRSSVNVIGSNTNGPGTGANQVAGGNNAAVAANAGTGEAVGQSQGTGSVIKVAPSGLFQQGEDGKFLFTTRAPFTQGNAAAQTNSDFFFQALNVDPAAVQKRLGDGYYEQSLVREQLANLTGKVSGSANDDSQYKALMTAGVSFAQEWHLTPGVALTAEQITHLTSNIVWMENQTVVLPDGTTQTVLAPKVYLAHVQQDAVKPNGALVTGENVIINVADITNKGGLIDGGNGSTMLLASNDISNLGGVIHGNQIVLAAGGDIRNETLTVTETYSNSQNRGSFTSLSNQATIGAGDSLIIQAGRDVTDIGGQISAGLGKEKGTGDILISAGRDINLDAAKTGSDYALRTAGHTGSANSTTYQTSQITSGSNLTLSAAQDMTLNGAQIAIGTNGSGSGTLIAGRDIAVNAVTNESKVDAGKDPGKNYTRLTTAGQSVVGSQIAATDDLTIKAGATQTGNLTVTGSTIAAGGNNVLAASGDVTIREAMENYSTDYFAHSSSKSLLKSSSSTTSETIDKQLVVGSNVSGKSVSIVSGNDIRVSGSQVNAEQDLNLLATRDITVTSATASAQESHYHDESKSGISFSAAGPGYTSASGNQQQNGTTTTQIGSVLSGATVNTVSGRDTLIKGSTIVADSDISLTAGRDLSIVSAENTSHSDSASSSKKSGSIGTFLQPAFGTVKTTGDGTSDSVTQVGSQIASLGTNGSGNITLSAGGQYTQTASGLLAQAGDIDITAKNVTINEAYDSYAGTQHQTYSKTAIGGSVSVPLVNAVQGAVNMAQAAGKTKNGRMQALAAVNAGADGYAAYQGAQQLMNGSASGIKVSVSLGNNKSESNSNQTAHEVVGSSIGAAGNVTIRATGAGKDSNLTATAADISAGGNVILQADNQVTLQAAQSTLTQQSNNKSSGTSIGIGFAFGGSQNGFTLDIGASQARGNANGTDIVNNNTHVTAGNTVAIQSGGDTTLKGAVVAGKTVVADVGGNLNIQSLQDTSTYDSKQTSASVGVSLCIPPFCYGASTASGSFSNSKVNGDFASVIEQSGIKAGDGGYQVNVTGNTDLKGAVIASSQAAIDANKNTLTTGTLTTSDIENHDRYDADSFGLSATVGTKLGDQTSEAAQSKMSQRDKAAAKADLPGGNSAGVGGASGSQSSVTQSGISGGLIVITDDKKQQDLTGKSAEQTLASLKTDITSDSNTAGALTKAWDGQQLQQDVQAQVQITQAFGATAAKMIGDYAEKKYKEALVNATQAQDDDTKAKYLAEAESWSEKGVNRIALHTLAGALTGGVEGAVGSAAAASSASLLTGLQKDLQQSLTNLGLSDDDAKTIAQGTTGAVATGLGAALGGTAGAATAFNTDFNNRQLHPNEKILARQLAEKAKAQGITKPDGSAYTASDFENALRGANNNALGETVQTGMVIPINSQTPANAIYDPTSMLLSKDGNGNTYLVQNPAMVGTPSVDLMNLIQANTGNTYTWSNVATPGTVTIQQGNPFASGWNTGEYSAGLGHEGIPLPDYVAINGNALGMTVNGAINLHNGQVYAGAGGSVPVTPGAGVVFGFIPSNYGLPGDSKTKNTDNMLGGAGFNMGGCAILCAGINHSYGGDTAIEIGGGIGTPSPIVGGVGYSRPAFSLPWPSKK